MITKVMLCGHSFVSRLRLYVERNRMIGFSELNCDTHMVGVSGANVAKLRDQVQLMNLKQGHVILQIGGNDLNNDNVKPRDLASDIIQLARMLVREKGAESVTICQLLFRKYKRGARYPLRDNYNELVMQVNRELKWVAEFFPKLKFWVHRRMNLNWEKYIHEDGSGRISTGPVRKNITGR